MRRDDGTIILWLLGLCLVLLLFGGLALDLWRGFSERRALAGAADAAVIAGAAGIDEPHWRATGQLRLDPPLAEQLAATALAAQPDTAAMTDAHIAATPDQLTVTITGQVQLTLLQLLPGGAPLDLTITARADPRHPPLPPETS